MKKFAAVLRVITIPPIMALLLLAILLFKQQINILTFIILLLFLAIFPSLSYLIEKTFKIYKKISKEENDRVCYRNLAIIMSLISYTIIFILVLFNNYSILVKQLVSTYFLSGILMFISTFAFKIKASGHMCGFSGPVTFLSVTISYYFLLLYLLIILVIWSSLKLKRHTIIEIILGFLIPIISFLISYFIIFK